MENYLIIKDKKIFFTLKKNKQARKIKIAIHSSGEVIITAPFFVSLKKITKLLFTHEDWLYKKIPVSNSGDLLKLKQQDYLTNKEAARKLVIDKLEYFNGYYKLPIKRIAIRNQRTRWGSCSSKGNLNFNYQVIKLPSYLSDYIVVHELCHLKELNHSAKFWSLVAETLPNYKNLRREIKSLNFKL